MRLPLSLLSILFILIKVDAQTPMKIVVEHFTNTKCSSCAARNPGLYTNLSGNSTVLHIAYHPSSPYNTCLLNNFNGSENDSRTNYYGIFGSTPRLALNGAPISGSLDYSSPDIFSPFIGGESDYSIKVKQAKVSTDSMKLMVTIIKVKAVTLASATLFSAIIEDTIFYSSPNGESKHYDVFRNSYTGPQGTVINLPSNIGDSITYTKTIKIASAININRIYSLALIQNTSTKSLLQAERTPALGSTTSTNINTTATKSSFFNIYPNPASRALKLTSGSGNQIEIIITNALGLNIGIYNLASSLTIDLLDYPAGVYFISAKSEGMIQREVFVKN